MTLLEQLVTLLDQLVTLLDQLATLLHQLVTLPDQLATLHDQLATLLDQLVLRFGTFGLEAGLQGLVMCYCGHPHKVLSVIAKPWQEHLATPAGQARIGPTLKARWCWQARDLFASTPPQLCLS